MECRRCHLKVKLGQASSSHYFCTKCVSVANINQGALCPDEACNQETEENSTESDEEKLLQDNIKVIKKTSQDSKKIDYKIKLVVLGDSGIGKTCFILRYTDGSFPLLFSSTVSIMDSKFKIVVSQDKRIELLIWDTAGQERFRALSWAYYRGVNGVILMYDVTNQTSLNSIKSRWWPDVQKYAGDNTPHVILVGNKCDKKNERVIPTNIGQKLADEHGWEFFEASARKNINVNRVFERLVEKIYESESAEKTVSPVSIRLNANPEQQKKGGGDECCAVL